MCVRCATKKLKENREPKGQKREKKEKLDLGLKEAVLDTIYVTPLIM